MLDEKNKQISDDYLRGQGDLIKIILPILAQLIIPYLKLTGTITLDIALLFDIPFIIILVWILVTSKKSTIDWDKFYDVMVRAKSSFDWGESLVEEAKSLNKDKHHNEIGGNMGRITYNNYILYIYLIALYESDKAKFAEELWDKARISTKSDEGEQTKS
ncbi:Uncharacterised protein [uncultured archaeon]|nr:Uncharacterised protein [uncultured archaeon]